LQGSTM